MGGMLANLGARSFYAAAPTLWNSLPVHIHEIESLGAFKRHVFHFILILLLYFY